MPYSTHGLSAETIALLTKAGLRPLDVESLAVRALQEDVDGGVDVTTVATVPMEQRGRLALVARGGGVVAGLVVARAIFDVVCGDDMTCDVSVEEGSHVEPGTELMAVTFIHPQPLAGRAASAERGKPPQRHCYRHPRVGRGGRQHRRRHSRHPQDNPWPARRREVRGSRRRRGSITA